MFQVLEISKTDKFGKFLQFPWQHGNFKIAEFLHSWLIILDHYNFCSHEYSQSSVDSLF